MTVDRMVAAGSLRQKALQVAGYKLQVLGLVKAKGIGLNA